MPQEATNDYLYRPINKGKIGIPVAAYDSEYYFIDNVFRLFTSADIRITESTVRELQITVQKVWKEM